MAKTIKEINERIKKGKAVVVTAEEIIDLVKRRGVKRCAREVDVITTATFGPMCSSGVFINFGHSKPKIKVGGGKVYLNDVPAYGGLAAADLYLGASALPDDDPRNKVYPGEFRYGGGHVIEELVAGKNIRLKASGYGTDCYPRKELETKINIKDLGKAILYNPRNAYQNYNVAVNLSDRVIYTYMGVLQSKLGNANYCSAGQLSPLFNDPCYETIGIGTRIFLGGGIGYVAWSGTQHNPKVKRTSKGIPRSPAGTLALTGELKKMSPKWLRGTSFTGYGATLTVGIGVPIPILDERVLKFTTIKDSEIYAPVIDYSKAYPLGKETVLKEVSYAQLRSGSIKIRGKEIPTSSLSSYARAREIANILKDWIKRKRFLLTKPVAPLP
jgi:uncharacterized protein (DUF39 family)